MKETTMKKKFLFISCEEAFEICDKSQYGEATLWEMIKLNLRFIYCKFTQSYVKKNKKLTQAIKSSNLQGLNTSERESLIEHFNQELKNQM